MDFGIVWGSFGDRLGVVWELFEDCLGVVWELFEDCLGVVWELFWGRLGGVWELFGKLFGVIFGFIFSYIFLYFLVVVVVLVGNAAVRPRICLSMEASPGLSRSRLLLESRHGLASSSDVDGSSTCKALPLLLPGEAPNP